MKEREHHIDENKPLAELFNIQAGEYSDIGVPSLPFSVRVLRRLELKRISTLQDLLKVNISFLKSIPGFGANCLSQVLLYCEGLPASNKPDQEAKKKIIVPSVFIANKDAIALGDFSFADALDLSETEMEKLKLLKEAYGALGEDLAFECVCSPDIICHIVLAFSTFVTTCSRHRELKNICNQIPAFRRGNYAKYYIDAFSYDEKIRSQLVQCYSSAENNLASILNTIDVENKEEILLAEKFLHWCSFDLKEEIVQLFNSIYSSPRIRTVIEGRANGFTLSDIGEQLGITRERVRQIEAKTKRLFYKHAGRIKLMSKLYADYNGQAIIAFEDIERISLENTAALVYFLKDIKGSIFTYDHQLDVFVFGDDGLSTRIQDYIDTLPDVLHKKDIPEVLNSAQEELDLDREYVEKALLEIYKNTGDVFHRTRLSLAKIYDTVLRKYFEKGIHIYDDKEIELLRQYIYQEYGCISLPSANRAIAARISSICVLAGRGIYIPRKDKWISTSLSQKILSFIMDSTTPILLVGNVFSVFEEELEREGIDNRYYLQGILRDLFGDRLYFRRDYVSKDRGFTSIYSSIIAFIKESKYPVKKEELKARFKGITDIVITLATSDNEILNYFGEYLHTSNLVISEPEKTYLSKTLSTLISDGDAHHIKDIYEEMIGDRPEIFNRNAAIGPFSAFSILEYLFGNQYQFSRPYIALHNVEIGRPNERLHELLYSKDEFSISDITDFAKENHMQIQSIIDLINSLNDRYLLRDKDIISSMDIIGINEGIAYMVDEIVSNEVDYTIPIRNLKCIPHLPDIKLPWTEWLIYSVINKWSKKLDVALSSNQLRQSIPLVSRKGKMDTSAYKDVVVTPIRITVDNMDDIDNLLADILTDEMLEVME